LAAQRCLTQCSCPVSLPDWRRRNRLCCLAPAAMQACRCCSVSAVLYSVEAAARRARERSCAGVWGSIGLAQRRRHCRLPRRYCYGIATVALRCCSHVDAINMGATPDQHWTNTVAIP
jgi:hypothetical protein